MKSTPSLVHHGLIAFVACGLFFVLAPKHAGAQDDPIKSVRPAALAWLALIDSAKLMLAYAAGGDGLHQVETQARWDAFLKYLLPGWGPLVSRKESEHVYQPNGIKGLNGECMAISYDTTFKKLPEAGNWSSCDLKTGNGVVSDTQPARNRTRMLRATHYPASHRDADSASSRRPITPHPRSSTLTS